MNNQLEKLKRDSVELVNFVNKLEKEGNHELVKKVIGKKEYLNQRIQEVFGASAA